MNNKKEQEQIKCEYCSEVLTEDNTYGLEGHKMCRHCYNELTAVCDCCGEIVWRDDTYSDNNIVICSSCYDNNYTRCEDCDCLLQYDEAHYLDEDRDYPYCSECIDKLKDKPIKSYNYKPEPKFYGSGNLFMGVELEIDKGGEYDENASEILQIVCLI